jgi:hypothetical protein
MSKKTELRLNLEQLKLLDIALNNLHLAELSVNEKRSHNFLVELVNEKMHELGETEEGAEIYEKWLKSGL